MCKAGACIGNIGVPYQIWHPFFTIWTFPITLGKLGTHDIGIKYIIM